MKYFIEQGTNQNSIDFVGTQIKEFSKLGEDGKFQTRPEYPEFVWKEIIVNAVCHRDYSIKGTDIQIKMFDDKLVVESPGKLPGLVRLANIRKIHFSRNPKIAGFLKDHTYVKEFGEGVDRMFVEMEASGLPAPQYRQVAFMTKVTIKNSAKIFQPGDEPINEPINLSNVEQTVMNSIIRNPKVSKSRISKEYNISEASVKRTISSLKKKGLIKRVGSNKAGHWEVIRRQD